jgi:hypothetical protein
MREAHRFITVFLHLGLMLRSRFHVRALAFRFEPILNAGEKHYRSAWPGSETAPPYNDKLSDIGLAHQIPSGKLHAMSMQIPTLT